MNLAQAPAIEGGTFSIFQIANKITGARTDIAGNKTATSYDHASDDLVPEGDARGEAGVSLHHANAGGQASVGK
jgi:hypothetical protein